MTRIPRTDDVAAPTAAPPSEAVDSAAPPPRLVARDLALGYGDRLIVDGLDLTVPPGVITTVIGPNGCGKSTLLRALARLLRPRRGSVLLDGHAISSMRTRDVARVLGMLPQAPVAPEGLTVADLVARGRHPHQSWLRQWSADDEGEVAVALDRTGITELADRPVDQLSGGQRQRAWISMALAQGTDVLLLDEPTTYLDLAHSVEVLDLVDRLHAELGRTVVMVLHDLNLAIRYSDHLVVMKEGRIVRAGPPAQVITEELLREVFALDAAVIDDPVSDRPLVVPIGTRHVFGTAGGPRTRTRTTSGSTTRSSETR
ncbi:ABC transporter ATP-binding protein [Rhodococcus ruber]|nr:ABC transporter ATP-binding protein [Rhodococcus ruber]RIK12561.1 MAG: ABC transporter ATP-binding protein [Acidobacteriota bacterium]AUM15097.1 ABC transporter ATP-binding protein [Rhodococcus ruber]AXY52410.1 iron-enterobactin transporter ATP-binding protein [Rhodococcus ruber]MBP2211769.1 iron complex transport system ATP-binding protein [Rhodococcus ruber]